MASTPHGAPAAAIAHALNDGNMHLLLAASGSVATIKLPLIRSSLKQCHNLSIRIVLTNAAARFLDGQSAEQPTVADLGLLPNVDAVYQDEDEWVEPWTRDANILHIELRRWAHLLVVAPMSANLLAKITGGLCDNLLTNLIRAWNTSRVKDMPTIMVAPAMNTMMWEHPLTAKQIGILKEWNWIEVLPPQNKTLACGDVGVGGMHDWSDISSLIKQRLRLVEAR